MMVPSFLLTSVHVSVYMIHLEAIALLHYQYLPWHKIMAAANTGVLNFFWRNYFVIGKGQGCQMKRDQIVRQLMVNDVTNYLPSAIIMYMLNNMAGP